MSADKNPPQVNTAQRPETTERNRRAHADFARAPKKLKMRADRYGVVYRPRTWRHDKWGGFWDAQGKAIALFRCLCGCKYWENYLCVDCGEHQSKADS